MDRSHRRGALAYGRRHPLGRSRAQVADGEEARMAGFERQREPPERPKALIEPIGGQRKVGEHKALFIEDCAARPSSSRPRPRCWSRRPGTMAGPLHQRKRALDAIEGKIKGARDHLRVLHDKMLEWIDSQGSQMGLQTGHGDDPSLGHAASSFYGAVRVRRPNEGPPTRVIGILGS